MTRHHGEQKMRVRFSLEAGAAKQVLLVGDFTDWQAKARVMRRASPRSRSFAANVNLSPGVYEYKFIVDGQWLTDPKAESVPNSFGTDNSRLVVTR
jgi:1,4-alpha-glucan branching enzyme